MRLVIGLDEVGRGAWAGPLVVAAVLLGEHIEGLDDSKKLSKRRRETMSAKIHATAQYVGVGWVSPAEVDDIGLTAATTLACERAIENAPQGIDIVIDGKINYLPERKNVRTIVNGDALEPAISAASIVAKVARDSYMTEQDELYPGYSFASHVGYGTLEHRLAIEKLGLSPIHRWTYKPFKDRFFKAYEI